MPHPLFERHRALLDRALQAVAERGYWSAFPESPSPKVYGEGAGENGNAAFDASLNKPFAMTLPGTTGTVGGEISPFGMPLGIAYPKVDVDALFAAVATAEAAWRKAGPEAWVGVSLEILTRINKRSFEIAHAVMHTTGQAFVMSFQASSPHAQDRALEAIAYAWDEMRRIPAKAYGEKPQGKNEPLGQSRRQCGADRLRLRGQSFPGGTASDARMIGVPEKTSDRPLLVIPAKAGIQMNRRSDNGFPRPRE